MRRILIAATLIAGLVSAGLPAPGMAGERVAFTPAAFAQAQAAAKPILVEIDASWCPNCAKQRPILAKLAAEPGFKDLVIMTIDFDTQKDAVRAMGATMQSTLIAYHGKDERARAAGITDEAVIRALVEKTRS